MKPASPGRTWRVRPWIRVAGVAALLGLAGIELDVYLRARMGETSDGDGLNGLVVLIVLGVAIWLLAFRPYIHVVDGDVVIRNVFRVTRFHSEDVVACEMTPYGLAFRLTGDQRPWTIVLQATMSSGEPRWFDVAEAVTGARPELETADRLDVDDNSARWHRGGAA